MRSGAIRRLRGALADQSGQDLVEYALLAGFVGTAALVLLTGLLPTIGQTYDSWRDPERGVPSLWEPAPPPSSSSGTAGGP